MKMLYHDNPVENAVNLKKNNSDANMLKSYIIRDNSFEKKYIKKKFRS